MRAKKRLWANEAGGFWILLCLLSCSVPEASAQGDAIALQGESSGGTLTCTRPAGSGCYVVLTNWPGETGAEVLARLAGQLKLSSNAFGGDFVRRIESNRIVVVGCPWLLGGTEGGFDIPPTPKSVSASYDQRRGEVTCSWINPSGGYDYVEAVYNGIPQMFTGKTTNWVRKHEEGYDGSISDVRIIVTGHKGGTPCNGGGIRLKNYVEQEVLMAMPFTQGVEASCKSWSHNTPAGAIGFKQGNFPGVEPGKALSHSRARFYQIIEGNGTFNGGVSRRFIGLAPGHTYQIGARINTLALKGNGGAFSLHGSYNPPTGEDLTPAQMAGVEALPNGAKGPTAGQAARYDSTTTKEGQWVERSSDKAAADNIAGNIVLPAQGSGSITVWFRLKGTNMAAASVGLDSIMIKDLGKR